jgi:predicted Zn-dependent protease
MRRIAAGLLIAGLIVAGQTRTRASDPIVRSEAFDQNQKKSDKDKVEQKSTREIREKEAEDKAAEQQESYHRLVEYAEGLYRDDKSTFRVEVDKQYRELMRAHADRAFRVNLSAKSEIKFIMEDRFRIYTGLYDNLLIQDVVNALGQKVAPSPSPHLFAFKLIADPVPYAEALSTGTIYISTGLVALLENEAQLAYVLAHEAAHVHRNHWFHRTQLGAAQPYYDAEKGQGQQTRDNIIKRIPPTMGAVFGFGRKGGMVGTALTVGTAYATAAVMKAKEEDRLNVDWVKEEEDEADQVAFNAMLDASYNVNQITKLYVRLADVARLDERSTLGFMGNPQRVSERHENVKLLLQTAQERMKGMVLKGDGGEFKTLMAELKRDNGILAYHYDMLQIAKDNLQEAVDARETDPGALYYYAKVLKLVGKDDNERAEASTYFVKAIQQDRRNENFGAHLHHATALLASPDPGRKKQASGALKTYIDRYGCAMSSSRTAQGKDLPPHMDTIYDYLNVLGEPEWTPYENHCLPKKAATPPQPGKREPAKKQTAAATPTKTAGTP